MSTLTDMLIKGNQQQQRAPLSLIINKKPSPPPKHANGLEISVKASKNGVSENCSSLLAGSDLDDFKENKPLLSEKIGKTKASNQSATLPVSSCLAKAGYDAADSNENSNNEQNQIIKSKKK